MFIKSLSVQYNAFINGTLHSSKGTDRIHIQGLKKYNRYLMNAYIYISYILIYIYIYISIFLHYMGRVWEAGIAIRYGLDGPEIESRWWRNFRYPSRPNLGPTQPTVWVSDPFPGGKATGAWSWPPTTQNRTSLKSLSLEILSCFMQVISYKYFYKASW
jgi:hypothetical protein